MAKQTIEELGSGALREALADLIKMHDERRMVSVNEANKRVDRAREALSLRSPACPCGSTEHTPETHFAQAASSDMPPNNKFTAWPLPKETR